jgi:hypothetical protein
MHPTRISANELASPSEVQSPLSPVWNEGLLKYEAVTSTHRVAAVVVSVIANKAMAAMMQYAFFIM